ncbi:hypothetical protein AB0L40_02515 [Patulibacter sp. NPDC049589]|uniref:hypothetical protein n=1 Tax=Patulibacter sp. NPDC049589 TaxID=3154731 RepID=UPI00343EAB5F
MSRLPNPEINLDPVLAAIVGAAIVVGGGAAAYGATRDTTPDPAPAPTAQQDDPVVARALKIVQRADGTAPAEVTAAETARRARAARDAASKGRSVDPFPEAKDPSGGATAGAGTTASGASSATSGSTAGASVPSAADQAKNAVATAAAANAAIQKATGGTPAAPTAKPKITKANRAAASKLLVSKPAKVTLRIATQKRRTTVSKRSLGLLVPNASSSVARVVKVNASNRVVTLRLRSGAFLTGPQSDGTMCIKRDTTGAKDCRLIRVRTGRTAVIRAPNTAKGRRGAVTAIRVLAVWRGGYKLAE